MIVMVDIDNILNDLTKKTIDLYNIRSGKNIKLSDITTYSFFKCLPNDAEPMCKLFTEKELWDSLEPIESSQEVLKDIVDMGIEVYLATATDPVNFEWKCEWVKKHYPFISTDNIIRIKNKSLLKCDVIIDDCLDNLINSDAEKICLYYPWNQSANINIHRAYSWIDILNIIERKNKEWKK
jgi:5'(3')-deoxyribonucleotidase